MTRVTQSRRPDRFQRHSSGPAPGEALAAVEAKPQPAASSPRMAAPGGGQPERWLLERLLRSCGNPPLEFVLWNGQRICLSAEPIARIRLLDRGTFWKVVVDPRMQFGEAYADGRLEVEGDLVEMMLAVDRALVRTGQTDFGAKHPLRWLRLRRRNNPGPARQNIHHHYDIGNDFYRLWLDEQLLYTCAYFAEPDCTLEQAQVAKMDHVCRKVWLQPGETVIEAGCGWGRWRCTWPGDTASPYGRSTRRTSKSPMPAAEPAPKAWTAGSSSLRTIGGTSRPSAMRSCRSECWSTLGRRIIGRLGDVIDGCLEPGGRGLIHSIGRNRPQPMDPWIERRIFPGAFPPSLREMMDIFEPHDFSLLDVENLRRHYALTLRHWLARFERSADEVQRMFDPRFARMWRHYIWPARLRRLKRAALQLFQVVFTRGTNHHVPRTRRHQYEPRLAAGAASGFRRPDDAPLASEPSPASEQRDKRQSYGQGAGHAAMRRPDRRRRPGGLDLRLAASSAAASMSWCSTRKTFPREKICAGWITPQVVDALELDTDGIRRRGRVFQPMTGFRTGYLAARRGRNPLSEQPVSYGIRRCEFDHYLLERSRRAARLGEPFNRAWCATAQAGSSTAQSKRALVIGAGGHFCPVARRLGTELATRAGHRLWRRRRSNSKRRADGAARAGRIEAKCPSCYFCDDHARVTAGAFARAII